MVGWNDRMTDMLKTPYPQNNVLVFCVLFCLFVVFLFCSVFFFFFFLGGGYKYTKMTNAAGFYYLSIITSVNYVQKDS